MAPENPALRALSGLIKPVGGAVIQGQDITGIRRTRWWAWALRSARKGVASSHASTYMKTF